MAQDFPPSFYVLDPPVTLPTAETSFKSRVGLIDYFKTGVALLNNSTSTRDKDALLPGTQQLVDLAEDPEQSAAKIQMAVQDLFNEGKYLPHTSRHWDTKLSDAVHAALSPNRAPIYRDSESLRVFLDIWQHKQAHRHVRQGKAAAELGKEVEARFYAPEQRLKKAPQLETPDEIWKKETAEAALRSDTLMLLVGLSTLGFTALGFFLFVLVKWAGPRAYELPPLIYGLFSLAAAIILGFYRMMGVVWTNAQNERSDARQKQLLIQTALGFSSETALPESAWAYVFAAIFDRVPPVPFTNLAPKSAVDRVYDSLLRNKAR